MIISIEAQLIQVGYDDTFYADSGSSESEATAYLDSMFTHVQTFFCHSTLGSKIQLQVFLTPFEIVFRIKFIPCTKERWRLHLSFWQHLES